MIDNEIKALNNDLITYKDYNQYIKTKIETISFLLYDEAIWGNYINSIDQKAKKYAIKLYELKNKYNFAGSSFGHVLDIDLKTSGRYKNMIKFINSLENSDLVVDIHNMEFRTNGYNDVNSTLNISVWGIRY
jgi:Tfp pilus assembly protein PilO